MNPCSTLQVVNVIHIEKQETFFVFFFFSGLSLYGKMITNYYKRSDESVMIHLTNPPPSAYPKWHDTLTRNKILLFNFTHQILTNQHVTRSEDPVIINSMWSINDLSWLTTESTWKPIIKFLKFDKKNEEKDIPKKKSLLNYNVESSKIKNLKKAQHEKYPLLPSRLLCSPSIRFFIFFNIPLQIMVDPISSPTRNTRSTK